MSSIASVGSSTPARQSAPVQNAPRAADGDSAATEAAESAAAKTAEAAGGGYAPHSTGAVNKLA